MKNKKWIGAFALLFTGVLIGCHTDNTNTQSLLSASQEKTAFQTSSPWKPQLNVDADVAIVYGTSHKHSSFDGKAILLKRG